MKNVRSQGLTLCLLMVMSVNVHAVSFEGLWYSYVMDISGDGSTVVGGQFGAFDTAFYWRRSTGIIYIPPLVSFGSDSILWGANYDGSVAAGYTHAQPDSGVGIDRRGATWTVEAGYSVLPPSGDNIFRDKAFAISGDGTTIVGHHQALFTSSPDTPLVWRNGVLATPTGLPSDVTFNGVSHDGSIIIGYRTLNPYSGDSEGVVWSEELGYRVLEALPGDLRVRANGISADGNVIVGSSSPLNGLLKSYAWSMLTGASELVMLDDDRFDESAAIDASFDGSVIVGNLYGEDVSAPYYWTEETGMVLLQDLLEDQYDVIMSGWQLISVAGVSDNGRTFTGKGINPLGREQVWIATTAVPLPGAFVFFLSGLALFLRKRV